MSTPFYDAVSITECDSVGDTPVVITYVMCRLGECVSCDRARGVMPGDEIPDEWRLGWTW